MLLAEETLALVAMAVAVQRCVWRGTEVSERTCHGLLPRPTCSHARGQYPDDHPSQVKGSGRVFASILLVILGVEVVVMIGLSALPAMPPLVAVFVDALLLAILSAPLLWLLVAKPLALSAEAEKIRHGARIASILQTSVDGIVTTDGRGIISQFNVGAEKIFGYAAREAVGQHLSVLFPEHAFGADTEGVALRQGRRKNGEIFPAEATVSTLDDGDDVIRTAVVRDISERSRAQQTLQDSEGRLRQAQQIAGIGNWELDLATNHLWWSEEIFRIFELDSTELGASYEAFLRAIHPDDRDRVDAAYTGSLENRTPYAIVHRLLMADGRTKFVEERCETDYASDGTPQRSRGTLQDVTERILAGESLRVQSAALNAAANVIVITDRNGNFEWVNPAFTVLTGYRAEEAIGRNPRELSKSGVHDPSFYRDLWDTILAGEVWRGEMTNRRKDGRHYSVHQTITPVRDDRGEITHFIAIQRDLTDQQRLEAQYLQAQKMEVVGHLASGIAHDFNNLLTVINGTADLALRDLGEDDPRRVDRDEAPDVVGERCRLLRERRGGETGEKDGSEGNACSVHRSSWSTCLLAPRVGEPPLPTG